MLMVYPKGVSSQRGEYLCLGIKLLADTSLPPGEQLFAEYKLRIRDQIHGQHHEKTDAALFSISTRSCWTYSKFLSLSAIHDTSKGFLVNDTLIVEGQIKRDERMATIMVVVVLVDGRASNGNNKCSSVVVVVKKRDGCSNGT
ncbi:hypothetical protein Vadar_030296 [Vaccinium darrowii]|uniref:Uncharacterized protein n=1 Tax=Vaccinium darrowii TaxID=229202 RepID=A0ACB7X531_9ERIC|nr:hypothetical protein Vadar_030296 [Vaccinium darrowii]